MKKRIISIITAISMLMGAMVFTLTGSAEGKLPFADVISGKWY